MIHNKPFINLKEMWLLERELDATRACGKPGGEPTKVKCIYIWANIITFAQM